MKREDFKKGYEDFCKNKNLNNDIQDKLAPWKGFFEKMKRGELSIEEWTRPYDKDKNTESILHFLMYVQTDFGAILKNVRQDTLGIRYDKEQSGNYIKRVENKEKSLPETEIGNTFIHIKEALKTIANAQNVEEINAAVEQLRKAENTEKYVIAPSILCKLVAMNSLMEDCAYRYQFSFIYSGEWLSKAERVLDLNGDGKTYFERSSGIMKQAKEWAELDSFFENVENAHEDKIKKIVLLYEYLINIINQSELSNFNTINIIYNGAPGTGKTYGVNRDLALLALFDPEKYNQLKPVKIQFHASYTYQDFIEGIKPFGIKDGNLNLQVVNGSFKQFCIDVRRKNEEYYQNLPEGEKPDPNKPAQFKDWPHYYFIVDEINRGNISNIFGEIFLLLEKSYRDYDFSGKDGYYEDLTDNDKLVKTALSEVIRSLGDVNLMYKRDENGVYFGIPFNIHFIGMMNDVDKNIDSFDLALRRRFKWIPRRFDASVIRNVLLQDEDFRSHFSSASYEGAIDDYVVRCSALNYWITGDPSILNGYEDDKKKIKELAKSPANLGATYELGQSFFLNIVNEYSQIDLSKQSITQDKREAIFDNYLAETVKEYLRMVVSNDQELDKMVEAAKKVFCSKHNPD